MIRDRAGALTEGDQEGGGEGSLTEGDRGGGGGGHI